MVVNFRSVRSAFEAADASLVICSKSHGSSGRIFPLNASTLFGPGNAGTGLCGALQILRGRFCEARGSQCRGTQRKSESRRIKRGSEKAESRRAISPSLRDSTAVSDERSALSHPSLHLVLPIIFRNSASERTGTCSARALSSLLPGFSPARTKSVFRETLLLGLPPCRRMVS